MSKHTPEPWSLRVPKLGMAAPDQLGDRLIISEEDGRHIAETYQYQKHGAPNKAETSVANAKRIIRCVNNCAGINPEAVPGLLEACKSAIKALKEHDPRGQYHLIEYAIAKAEGE